MRIAISHASKVAYHCPISSPQVRLAAVGHAKLLTSALDNILDVDIVSVTDGREQVVFNLVVEASRKMIPKP